MVAAIERWRDEIDAVDAELLALLNRRAGLALEVGRRKQGAGLPLRDARRERQILDRAIQENAGPLDPAAIKRLFRAVLAESRRTTRRALSRKSAMRAEGSRACA
ncbi:MAG TPA: chorismate mutase [Candidatus Acidoferrales bacterium]|nr:chorismate mutase [Candidatus Acidoferrales bacterium]